MDAKKILNLLKNKNTFMVERMDGRRLSSESVGNSNLENEIRIDDLIDFIEQQAKEAELGRLILDNKNDGGIHICYSKVHNVNKIGCKYCDCKEICQLRAELLKEG